MNKMVQTINEDDIDISELIMTYPGGGVWSRKAIAELLKQLNDIGCGLVDEILEKNPNIQQAGNPTELAEALSDHIPKGIVLLPIYNKYGGNVTGTLMSIMDYYEKNGVMPRILGNVEIEIEHCLCGKEGQNEEQIKNGTIYSHWQAIKQCNKKIEQYGIKSKNVDGTSQMLNEAKQNEGVFLLLDKDTAKRNGLQIYDKQMGPKNNRTSFAIITSDPNINLPKINGNKNINVGIIKADNYHGGLLLSLLPLILSDKKIDMKAITSRLNGDIPMIGIIGDGDTFDQAKGMYEQISLKNTDALKTLMRKLNIILRQNYNIKIKKGEGKKYVLTSKNKPGALIKMLVLLEYNEINLNSIDSEIDGDLVHISIETDNKLNGISETNMPEGIKQHLITLVEQNTHRVHEIITE